MTTKKKKDGEYEITGLSLAMVEINELGEEAQLAELMLECFPGAQSKPIVLAACQHSMLLRRVHTIATHGTDEQRRQAIVALSSIVFNQGEG